MSRASNELYDIVLEYQTHTRDAVCVRADKDGDDIWLPKSAIEYEGSFLDCDRGESILLSIPLWLIEKNDLTEMVE